MLNFNIQSHDDQRKLKKKSVFQLFLEAEPDIWKLLCNTKFRLIYTKHEVTFYSWARLSLRFQNLPSCWQNNYSVHLFESPPCTDTKTRVQLAPVESCGSPDSPCEDLQCWTFTAVRDRFWDIIQDTSLSALAMLWADTNFERKFSVI